MALEENAKKRLCFTDKGKKIAMGAMLVASSALAMPTHAAAPTDADVKAALEHCKKSGSPKQCAAFEAILKSPGVEVTYGPRTDCIDDNSPRTFNLFIGGFFDMTMVAEVTQYTGYLTDAKLTDEDKDKGKSTGDGIKKELPCNLENRFTTHDNPAAFKDEMEKLPPNAVINIIGHSMGGNAAIELAGQMKRKVNLLVTVDPVRFPADPSGFPKRPPIIGDSPPPIDKDVWKKIVTAKMRKAKPNVTTWVNILPDPEEKYRNSSDFIADRGQKYGTLPNSPEKFVDIFVHTEENHGNFVRMITCPTVKDDKTVEELLLGKKVFQCVR